MLKMNRTFRISLPFRVLLLLAVMTPVRALEVGEPFPVVSAERMDAAGTFGTDELRGKVVYVDAWASWCTPCRIAMPVLEEWQQRWAKEGFVVLGLNVDADRKAAQVALKRAGVSYPVIHGVPDETLTTLGMQTMPTAWLLDREGNVRLIHSGFRKADIDELETAIQEVLEEQ